MSQAGNSSVSKPAPHLGVRWSDLLVGLAAPLAAALLAQAAPQAARPSFLVWLLLLATLSGSWWGGLRAGLPAAGLGAVLCLSYPADEPPQVSVLFGLSGITNGLMLGLCGCLIAGLGEQFHRTRRQAAAIAKQALQHQRELECEVGERKRAEVALRAGEESLRMALEASRTVAWSWDLRSGRIEHSQTSRLVLGGTPESVEQFVALIHPDDRQRVEDALIRVLDGRGAYDEVFRIVRTDGEVRWVADEGNLVYGVDGSPERLVGCLRDVTEQHRILEALGEADRRKDEFLAMLAHELRNPLAPIRTAVRLLQLQQMEPGPHRHLELIDRQVGNMARLLEDLLDVSRITRGTVKLKVDRVELGQVVREALEVCHPLIRQRQHLLEMSLPDRPVLLVADRLRLEQVIVNLVNNAAKYTDAGGHISVEVEVRERFTRTRDVPRSGNLPDTGSGPVVGTAASPGEEGACRSAEIRVRDTGRGIPPELLPRVFDLFVQGEHGLDRSQGGLGIGLTMVRRLVEMHGGAVTVESAGHGRGSVFTVSLPLAENGLPGSAGTAPGPEGGSTVAVPAPLPSSSGSVSRESSSSSEAWRADAAEAPRILVVDDSRDGAEALLELVEIWGYEGKAVFDGPSALRAVESFQPAVVICDLEMPGMDGYTVARRLLGDPAGGRSSREIVESRLRDDARGAGKPGTQGSPMLIAVTGYGREEDRQRSAEAGFGYHLTKPIDPEELLGLLKAFTPGEGIGVP